MTVFELDYEARQWTDEELMDIKQLNKQRLADIKKSPFGTSHGLEVFIKQIEEAQKFNAEQPQVRPGEEYRRQHVTVYFSWVTNNRLAAHIIIDNRLERLSIPEAGHRFYANNKDGYQANGGGYNKPFHILEAMVFQAQKHSGLHAWIGVMKRDGNWQDFIKAEVI